MKGEVRVDSSPKFKKLTRAVSAAAGDVLRSLKRFAPLRYSEPSASVDIFLVDGKVLRTNVLAFRAPKGVPRPDRKGRFLGEVYLNPDYVKQHRENLLSMVIHGVLHLAGYDHERSGDRIAMEARERRLFKRLKTRYRVLA